jgi:phage-related protein
MPSIGAGVMEIRVHGAGEYRVIYVAKYIEAIYVLHAFEKRSQRTRQGDIELARSRFRLVERSHLSE